PLVIYEGLKLNYPWASWRLHRFILEGMRVNAETAAKRGWNYWPFVETPQNAGRGLMRKLATKACVVVTDDFPCFIIPDQTAALPPKTSTAWHAVGSNSIVPTSLLGPPASAAAQLRRRLHCAFADAWQHRAAAHPRLPELVRRRVKPPFKLWRHHNLDRFL